tara:strand:+ start:74 stop:568 length:495 start_codon:yes stop_codon:yes gene_type:complete
MIIQLKKNTIFLNEFKLKCSVGKGGIKIKNREGDKITPKGIFSIGKLLYRQDRIDNFVTKLEKVKIKRNMGWCDDSNSSKYNRLVKITKNFKYSHEKLFRKGRLYDLLIPIKYNYKKTKKNKGSAIFFHLTSDYKPTLGCVALKKKDFLIMLKLINKKDRIRIF